MIIMISKVNDKMLLFQMIKYIYFVPRQIIYIRFLFNWLLFDLLLMF